MNQQRQEVQIRHYVQVDPPTPEFRILEKGSDLSFIPLDAVWPDGNGNTSGRAAWDGDPKSYTQFRRGDILLPKVSPTFSHGRAMIADTDTTLGLASSEVYALRPHPQVDPRFISYALRSTHFLDEGTAAQTGMGGLRRVSAGWVKSYKLALFSSGEQRRIAEYLDRETGQIDETITRIDRVVELMSERHQAFLRGQVLSERYPRVSLGLLTEIANGSTPNKNEPGYWSPAEHSEAVPWMSSTVVNQPTATTPTAFVTPRAVKECHLPTALPGDVLVAITGQGKTRGMATILTVETTLNQHVVSVRPNKKITSEFLVTALRALYDELRRESESNGSTRAAITIEQLERFQIPLPDLNEQVAITGEIASAQSNTELMLHKASHLRSLLEERRSALITAAVTGRIEV